MEIDHLMDLANPFILEFGVWSLELMMEIDYLMDFAKPFNSRLTSKH